MWQCLRFSHIYISFFREFLTEEVRRTNICFPRHWFIENHKKLEYANHMHSFSHDGRFGVSPFIERLEWEHEAARPGLSKPFQPLVIALPISYLCDSFLSNKKGGISCRGSSSRGISICSGVDHRDTRCLIRALRGGCTVMVFETDCSVSIPSL